MCVEELLKIIYNMSISCQLIFINSPKQGVHKPLPSICLGEMDRDVKNLSSPNISLQHCEDFKGEDQR